MKEGSADARFELAQEHVRGVDVEPPPFLLFDEHGHGGGFGAQQLVKLASQGRCGQPVAQAYELMSGETSFAPAETARNARNVTATLALIEVDLRRDNFCVLLNDFAAAGRDVGGKLDPEGDGALKGIY